MDFFLNQSTTSRDKIIGISGLAKLDITIFPQTP